LKELGGFACPDAIAPVTPLIQNPEFKLKSFFSKKYAILADFLL
jgi:hypothetical protein